MVEAAPQFIEVGEANERRRIATLALAGTAGREELPGLVWLPGFKSDMVSTKASALADWCAAKGLAFTRFDYSGHGQSSGHLEGGTISRWLEEAGAVVDRLTVGPQVLVGSSMGGYIALLLLRHNNARANIRNHRVKALVLIAPAWDMTEELMWKRFSAAAKEAIVEQGVWHRPSAYGAPYPITRGLIEDGRKHLLGRAVWDPGCPVRIMHGLLDPDVPWEHSLDLEASLSGDWTRVSAIPDGEHRLSRPQDLEMLFSIIDDLLGRCCGQRTADKD